MSDSWSLESLKILNNRHEVRGQMKLIPNRTSNKSLKLPNQMFLRSASHVVILSSYLVIEGESNYCPSLLDIMAGDASPSKSAPAQPENVVEGKEAKSPEQPPLPDEEPPPPLPEEDLPPPLPTDEEPPQLPKEGVPPPLPTEEPPAPDDGWEPLWDNNAQAFYFYNRVTKQSQWDNPRVPDSSSTTPAASGLGSHDRISSSTKRKTSSGYNPAIHGDYDPNADYAQEDADSDDEEAAAQAQAAAAEIYAATGTFNRFTGKWQRSELNPEKFSDENKSSRQMGAFFDVDAAANVHDGRSLKAERQSKKFSKKEIKAFKEKRREKKEEKRRAWLRD
jgi:hypothetical protein